MNSNEYLKNLELKNRALLLKIYKREQKKLLGMIADATAKGNDTEYLESLKHSVDEEIKRFDKQLAGYSAISADKSYNSGAKLALLNAPTEIANAYSFGTANHNAIKYLAKATYQPLSKMAQKIGRSTKDYMNRENFKDTQTALKALNKIVDSEKLREIGIEGVADVVVGSKSWGSAARKIRDAIMSDGELKVPYYKKDGSLARMVEAKDYAKMVARTTTAHCHREGAKDSVRDVFDGEFDLVEILGISTYPKSPCIPYQHQILSIDGKVKGYTTFAEAEANGLFHVNCIHSFGITDKVMEVYRNIDTDHKPQFNEVVNDTENNKSVLVKENKQEQDSKISEGIEPVKKFDNGEQVNKFFYDNKEYKQWTQKLTQDEKDVINQYTEFSDDINQYLRKIGDWQYIDKEIVTGQIKELDKAINNFELQKPIQVLRGVGTEPFGNKLNDINKIIGEEFIDKAYTSTSLIETGTKQDRPVMLFLNVPAGKGRGAYINEFSTFNNEEYEFLLKRNSRYKITNAKYENGIYLLEADILP